MTSATDYLAELERLAGNAALDPDDPTATGQLRQAVQQLANALAYERTGARQQADALLDEHLAGEGVARFEAASQAAGIA